MQRPATIQVNSVPDIHPKIELRHILPNGRILSDDDIKRIKNEMKKDKSFSSPFDNGMVIKIDEQYYANYGCNSLGEGHFGAVVLSQHIGTADVQDMGTGVFFAVKEQKPSNISAIEYTKLSRAKRAHGELKEKDLHSIVMDLASGVDLHSLTNPRFGADPLPMATIRRLQIGSNAIEAIEELHKTGLLHCDIKGKNFMVNPITGKVSYIDLGFATEVKDPKTGIVLKNDQGEPLIKGTEGYMAPEIDSEGRYSEASDVYALGITLADLFGLKKENAYNTVDRDSDEFINNTFIPDPQTRASVLILLQKMIDDDSNKRPTLAEAKALLHTVMENQVTLAGKIQNVGLLDMTEYKKANEAEKEQLLQALQNFDEVAFVNPTPHGPNAPDAVSKNELALFKRQLQDAGIAAGDTVYSNHSTANIVSSIPGTEAKLPQTAIKMNFYVTNDKGAAELAKNQNPRICPIIVTADKKAEDYRTDINKQYQNIMDPKDVTFAISELKVNINNLEKEHRYEIRTHLMKEYVTWLTANSDNVTYAKLVEDLGQIQKKMAASAEFSDTFRETASKIGVLREDLKERAKHHEESKLETRAGRGGRMG